MNFEPVVKIINILLILEIFIGIQASHIRDAKTRIREEIRHAIGPDRILPRKEISEIEHDVRQPTHKIEQRRWSHRRRLGAQFTPWTEWSECDTLCRKTRESYCKVKRKCGDTKHVEERECRRCHIRHQTHSNDHLYHTNVNYGINEQHSLRYHHHEPNTNGISLPYNRLRLPVYQEIYEPEDDRDYYVIKKRPRYKKKRKPILIEVDDYEDLEDEDPVEEVKYKRFKVKSIRTKNWNRDILHKEDLGDHSIRNYYDDISKRRNLYPQTGSPGYEDEEYAESKDNTGPIYVNNEYEDEYEETYLGRNSPPFKGANNTIVGGITSTTPTTTTANPNNAPREKAVFELPPRYKRVYSRWSKWSKCSPKCTTRRYKKCRIKDICGKEVLREIAYCYTEGSFCQQWLETQAHKTPPYDLKPVATSRKDVVSPNAIENDFVLTGRGYRGPEYTPLKLKCGIPSIRNSRRNNMNNMLKIIGGRTSRKGQWPWQVVIFNRFKEAFCGGTLIAPTWVLTAAHCVRKVLYVRIGEHNLDVEDGTEIEFRVLKSIKHPNYDKKTVDSDVALLRLPQPVNNTNWIGFACMPRPYQSLPKNIQCTVIGWGKRRNRDQAGTSLLHQAEVPIIPMDNCKAVYYDYTITKNMFCAGHKRGRIDTCAGDSGGPLLCRDGTKPNHPWTIFGITSFGDGCAKRNKFGIYAKVPNYVDWVWSVVNCNGNCKSTNRRT